MKFKIERSYLVRTFEEVELNPKNFLHCTSIEELNNEIEDFINRISVHPSHPHLELSEELGTRFWDTWFEDSPDKSFYLEWQKLKGLPQEL